MKYALRKTSHLLNPTSLFPYIEINSISTPYTNTKSILMPALKNSNGQTPESGIPPSDRATRRYTKLHLDFCLRLPTLIGQIGRVPLFSAGPKRYIRSLLFTLAVTIFWRALTGSRRAEGKRTQVLPRAIRTAELPSNPSPLTFWNNLTGLFGTRNHGSQRFSASYQRTRHVVVTCSHAHTTRDKGTKALTVPRRPPVRANTHTRSRGWRHPS